MTKIAVCALIRDNMQRVLSVSRKDNPNDKGLPGGKVDPGEDPVVALKREIMEETGLTLNHYSIRLAFSAIDGEYLVYTYICDIDTDYRIKPVDAKETGVIEYVDWSVLLHSRNTFSTYNQALYDSLHNY